MKKIYIIMVVAALLVSCKEDTNPPVLTVPEMQKAGIDVSYHGAEITDTVTMQNDNAEIVLYYSTDANIGTPSFKGQMKNVAPTIIRKEGYYIISSKITGLDDDTEYYYTYGFMSQFDKNKRQGKVSKYSVVRSFRTLKNDAPIVETVGCYSYGFYTAELAVTKISDNSDSQTTSWGVCYSTHSGTTANDGKVECQSNDDETVHLTLNGLTPGTKYYFRAFGVNKYGTSYGEEQCMTTVSASVMSVETKNPTVVESNYAIVAGEITSHAALNITERGFYISSTNTAPDENDTRLVSEVSGEGAYQVLANGLNGGTTYYVRAYAVCQYGELMGNVVSFVTGQ